MFVQFIMMLLLIVGVVTNAHAEDTSVEKHHMEKHRITVLEFEESMWNSLCWFHWRMSACCPLR